MIFYIFREQWETLQNMANIDQASDQSDAHNLMDSNEVRLLYNTTSGDVKHINKRHAKKTKERHVTQQVSACRVGDTVSVRVNGNKLKENHEGEKVRMN